MVSFLLQENIDELQNLADHLLHIGDKNGYVYADDLSALQQSIHEKINDLYSQRGETPEQDATLCLAILQGYNVRCTPIRKTRIENGLSCSVL